mgnify:CR=1 FL=1
MFKIKTFIYLILIFSFLTNNLLAKKIEILYKVENHLITNKDVAKEINYLLMLNSQLKTIEKDELIKYATKSIIKEKVKKNEILKNFKFGGNEQIIERHYSRAFDVIRRQFGSHRKVRNDVKRLERALKHCEGTEPREQ